MIRDQTEYEFKPDAALISELCFRIYRDRLETQPPRMEEDKMRKNSAIYEPVVRLALCHMNDMNLSVPGDLVEKRKPKAGAA